ncbi:hypothetical protein [Lacticaseibacillus suihuaensis]
MTVQMIPLTIDAYDGAIAPYDRGVTLDPIFLVRIVAKPPHWSETIDGDVQLRRPFIRQMKRVIAPVVAAHREVFGRDAPLLPAEVMADAPVFATDLARALETLMVPGELVLDSIDLVGGWPAYEGKNDALSRQLYQ